MKVMFDPGHGGYDPGAVGPRGTLEKQITWAVCQILKAKAERWGWITGLTHDGSESELSPRVIVANRFGADCVVSIHCNSAENPKAEGFEIYTSPGTTDADSLATSIFEMIKVYSPGQLLRADFSDGDPDKEARFQMLTRTEAPAVLVELDFINNPKRELWLADPAVQEELAELIIMGIERWNR